MAPASAAHATTRMHKRSWPLTSAFGIVSSVAKASRFVSGQLLEEGWLTLLRRRARAGEGEGGARLGGRGRREGVGEGAGAGSDAGSATNPSHHT